MAEILSTRFQLRRGNESAWIKNNPILASGEPGFVIDKNQLKIGDGVTAWKDLPYISNLNPDSNFESGVFNAETKEKFPEIGDVNIIYKAQLEGQLYQWNSENQSYEALISKTSFDETDTLILYGGSASDLVEV